MHSASLKYNLHTRPCTEIHTLRAEELGIGLSHSVEHDGAQTYTHTHTHINAQLDHPSLPSDYHQLPQPPSLPSLTPVILSLLSPLPHRFIQSPTLFIHPSNLLRLAPAFCHRCSPLSFLFTPQSLLTFLSCTLTYKKPPPLSRLKCSET